MHAGATLPDGDGWWFAPTVLSGVTTDMPIAQEEIFGPVAMVIRVPDVDAAIAAANDTTFGLGSSVWSTDEAEIARCVEGIEAGAVFVNAMVASMPELPFGGIKRSGYGRELSELGLEGVHQRQDRLRRLTMRTGAGIGVAAHDLADAAVTAVTYLDHAATTPLRPEVAAAMAEVHADSEAGRLGNPTGSHPPAQRARRLLEEARDEVAAFLGRDPGDIVFTSGGTESANLAVLGARRGGPAGPGRGGGPLLRPWSTRPCASRPGRRRRPASIPASCPSTSTASSTPTRWPARSRRASRASPS